MGYNCKIWLKYSQWFRSYNDFFLGGQKRPPNDLRVIFLEYDLRVLIICATKIIY